MMNDWYRLNMEVVLTANKFSGIDPGIFHDGLTQQINRQKQNSAVSNLKSRILNFWK